IRRSGRFPAEFLGPARTTAGPDPARRQPRRPADALTTIRQSKENHMAPSATDNMKSNLGQTGGHLKDAAGHAGEALKGAATAAGDEVRLGKANVKADLADSALSGIAALEQAGAASREQMDALMDKSRDLIDSASEL